MPAVGRTDVKSTAALRWRLLTACFPKASFHSTKVDKIIKTDRIDNNLCPYATLPNDWNSYLDQLSTNTRQKIRRLLKQVETSSEYRISVATSETFDRDLKTLLGFWDTKWRARKADRIDSLIRSNGSMLTRSFRSGLVYLPTFRNDRRSAPNGFHRRPNR